jgi:hypothetical protein
MNEVKSTKKYFTFFKGIDTPKAVKIFLFIFLVIYDLSLVDSILTSGKNNLGLEYVLLVVSFAVFAYIVISFIKKRSKKNIANTQEEAEATPFTNVNPFKRS